MINRSLINQEISNCVEVIKLLNIIIDDQNRNNIDFLSVFPRVNIQDFCGTDKDFISKLLSIYSLRKNGINFKLNEKDILILRAYFKSFEYRINALLNLSQYFSREDSSDNFYSLGLNKFIADNKWYSLREADQQDKYLEYLKENDGLCTFGFDVEFDQNSFEYRIIKNKK